MRYKKYKFISSLIVLGIVAGGFIFLVFLSGKGIKCKDCNIIMISLSNVSAEHMSLYGYERVTTPNLDKWAEDAVVFENVFTQTSWTLPVATSLFTSLYPYTHKISNRLDNNILDKNIQTLPEILKDQGYKTAAFTGGLDYGNIFGHMRGFEDSAEAADPSTAVTFAGFSSTLDKASDWMQKNSNEKFFLFIHGYDAHCPFDPPEQFRGTYSNLEGKNIIVDNKICLRGFKNSDDGTYEAYYFKDGAKKVVLAQEDINYLEDLYDEEILSVDDLVSNFLSGLNGAILDNTIIIVFSDHGEMFAKHGRFGRAGGVRGTLYDDVVHIPLIMKVPKQSGKTVNGLVQIIDVMPTLLDMLGLTQPKQTQGKNLAPLISREEEEVNEYVFAGSKFGIQEIRPTWPLYPFQSINESVRSREWKLIHEITFNGEGEAMKDVYELYNMKDDPDELHDLKSEQYAVFEELKEVLGNWKDTTQNYDIDNAPSRQLLPPEIIEAAKEHGYW